jgi:hypothetical protein
MSLVLSSVVACHSGGAPEAPKPTPEPGSLEEAIADFRAQCVPGRLDSSFKYPLSGEDSPFRRDAKMCGGTLWPSELEFDAMDDDHTICFELNEKDSDVDEGSKPSSKSSKQDTLQRRLDDKQVWITAVKSLDELRGPAFPARAPATDTWTANVLDTNVNTNKRTFKSENVKVEVSKTTERVTSRLCATNFNAPPDARYLVLVSYHPPEDSVFRDLPAKRYPAVVQAMIWTLSKDGSSDLSH